MEESNNRDSDDDDDDEDEMFRIRGKPKTMEDILGGSEDEDEDDDDLGLGDNVNKNKKKVKKQKQAKSFIKEDADGIVDFLDPSAAQKVTSMKPNSMAKNLTEEEKKKKKNGGFKIASDGRLIIKDNSDDDDDEEGGDDAMTAAEAKKRKYMMMEDDDLDSDEENTFKNMVSTSAARKRKMGGSIASSRKTGFTDASMKYQAGGTGIHRPLDSKSTKSDYGSEYKAKKARGDVKRKDAPDPYAYVPLQKSTLNRRKRAKNAGQFKGLVKAAKSGASIGSKKANKNKMKDVKQMMKKMKVK